MDFKRDEFVAPQIPADVRTRFDRREGRLTWSPGHILPFESAWMVCAKAMAINHLKWSELKRLIAISRSQLDSRINPFISGRWVDIDKFSRLLGEPYEMIESSFLSVLGFPESLAYRVGISHCPECASLGYHCSLFNIQALLRCPWHDVRLTNCCVQCARTVQSFLLRGGSDQLTCPACGIRIVDPADPLARDEMTAQRLQEAFTRCTHLVKWWRDVRDYEPCANELFGSALCSNDELDILPTKLHLRIGCLQKVALPPEFQWLSAYATPGDVIAWADPVEPETGDKVSKQDSRMRCYRSVRRKIFRKFVRPHRRCLAILCSMSRCAWTCLERDYACTVCVAYFAWRHAHEGGPKPSTGLYLPGSGDGERGLPPRCTTLSPTSMSNIMYVDYLRLLMELEREYPRENIMVVSASRNSQTFLLFGDRRRLPLPSTVVAYLHGWQDAALTERVTIPDGGTLARLAYDRCKRRRNEGEVMDGSGDPDFGFGPQNAMREMCNNDVLFRLQNSQRRVKRAYIRITA